MRNWLPIIYGFCSLCWFGCAILNSVNVGIQLSNGNGALVALYVVNIILDTILTVGLAALALFYWLTD